MEEIMKKMIILTALSSICLMVGQMNAATQQLLSTNTNARTLEREFARNFPGNFSADTSKTEQVGSYTVPQIRSGDMVLNNSPTVDNFTARTKAPAVIYAKVGNDFVIIASSLKKADGTSAIGTALEQSSPAYSPLKYAGNFNGKVTLFGKDYLAEFSPIKDKKGQTIGALLVAMPVSNTSSW
jgi:methyl-accepting chemotaxis protein